MTVFKYKNILYFKFVKLFFLISCKFNLKDYNEVKLEEFMSKKNPWERAIEICGGTPEIYRRTGVHTSTISLAKNGKRECTPEQAIKVSMLTNLQVKAEDLLSSYDFSILEEYFMLKRKIKK